MESGHSGRSGRTAAIEEVAFDYAFAFKNFWKTLRIYLKTIFTSKTNHNILRVHFKFSNTGNVIFF